MNVTIDELYQIWLENSYLYYILDKTGSMSDNQYDLAANDLMKHWNVCTHPAKHLITEDDLRCGSAFHLKAGDYPEDIRNFHDEEAVTLAKELDNES